MAELHNSTYWQSEEALAPAESLLLVDEYRTGERQRPGRSASTVVSFREFLVRVLSWLRMNPRRWRSRFCITVHLQGDGT